ncbi:MAG TPA: GatB/YqeY domain-containing protein [Longilinea sp.]|nr:GatB/YqeY domain-containing protein [Longilinea sp.]
MNLQETLVTNLHTAMRENDVVTKRTIRMVLSAIKLAEIDKGEKLDDAGIIAILQKEIKIRNEAVQDAERAKRDDLVIEAKGELKVIETFLPDQLTDNEIEVLVKEAILETNASGPADLGKVMKAVMPKLQGRAAGDKISQIARKLLFPG